MSYDNTGGLGANTRRRVAFIEQRKPLGGQEANASVGLLPFTKPDESESDG